MDNKMMEWTTGDLVWFDPGVGHWLPGEVLECHRSANVLTVQAVINGKPQTFALSDGEGSVRKRQDLGINGVEDMTQLSDLHEAALLWNLKLRYDRNLIYTYTGSILVAVNPYRMFDSSYGIEAAQKYKNKMIGELPPHLFALGAGAYSSLPIPQVVVISGESGSGKTESTKLVMQYLAAVAPSAPHGHGLVTEQILEATPLLEAFGNARTTRNDNSSRFGKYLEVYFKNGSIIGAKLTQYLLEKSRIVTQAPGERNYHVFYELLGGLNNIDKQKYGLVDADKYFYLNQGGSDCAPGHSGSGADWVALKRAMQILAVGENEQEGIIKILASILHLGNVYFHRRQLRHGQEGVEIGSDIEIKWAAHLLQISSNGLKRSLTSRITETRTEKVYSPLTIDQALDARDAFAKALYSALFNWLVTRINSIIQKGGLYDAARISLLDIFGFENFLENSFEQLCINFASESLQMYFNKHVFKLEQQEYIRERLEWTNMSWIDNSPVIQLLGKKPVGILHLLDDESNFPRASDSSFLEKCHYNHALNENYCRPRVGGGREFGIKHFAGQVWYSVDGFLDKNRDALRPDVIELIASSKEPLVCSIAKPLLNQTQSRSLPKGANGRFVTMKPRTPTVAARFSDSLQQLLESMSRCNPWFIRCIKPNNDKTPMRFDMPVVLEQLRYLGMLDTIKIRQSGYPIRIKFQQFVERYRYLLPGSLPRGAPFRDLCRAILEQIPNTHTGAEYPDYQMGATRIFLREKLERELEIKRSECLRDSAILIQKHIRGYLARKKYKNLKKNAIIIQKHWQGYKQRKNYKIIRNGIIKAQALIRGKYERKRFKKRKADFKRRIEAEKIAQEREKQRLAKEAQAKKAYAKSSVHHLEIPAELAFIFSKLENYTSQYNEKNLIKVLGGITGSPPPLNLPPDLNQYEFGRFSSVYFKGAELGVKKEPIIAPFLSKAAARDQDFQDAIAIFKLILRWTNDNQLNGNRERALADYIVHKGLTSRGLRDEILIQLCNQVWKNDNPDRIWQLMAHCLSCFQPSPPLSKYLLKFITDYSSENYKELLQQKLIGGLSKNPHARSLPPTLLEWKSIKQGTNTALPLTLPDNNTSTIYVYSWTTCEEAASLIINTLGIPSDGWSVVMDDCGVLSEGCGLDYIMDLVSELELYPSFPITKSSLLKTGTKKQIPMMEILDHHHHTTSTPIRPQVPPPEPPVNCKINRHSPKINSRKSSIYSQSPITTSTPTRKSSHEALSRNSALNERYFDIEKVRSRSLDNLLGESEPNNPLADLGLSQSRLNDRYHSVEQLAPIQPILNKDYQKEIDFEYPDINSGGGGGTLNRGGPRYIKSSYTGKKAPPGSHSSRAHIEKGEFAIRSSAMSDTSETPSLASHVRRVRVPSQASDVDQFLDELFSPVLDGNLDELSDARSLANSIKGGSVDDFINDILEDSEFDLETVQDVINRIKGGGSNNSDDDSSNVDEEVKNLTQKTLNNHQETNDGNVDDYISDLFRPIFINDSLKKLTEKNLAENIKGGGTTHSNGSGPSSFTFPNIPVGSPPMLMPLLSPTQDGFMPVFNPQSSLPPNTDMAAYQQNLQRAFLQSAMAQNIQIQQQLLAQNQALQQLLSQSSEVKVTETIHTSVKAKMSNRKSSFRKSPTRKTSAESNMSISMVIRNGVPPPPPMPPPIDGTDPSETRPFLDPYGRAKTVRIGKWRWPPPQDEKTNENGEDFLQFKMRQNQRKVTPVKDQNIIITNGKEQTTTEWEEIEFEPIIKENERHIKNNKKSFEIGASRPSPGSIGKLKLSTEMKQRLEKVTASHSVRSTSSKIDKPTRSINKLEDTRKMMLEQQLAGRWGDEDSGKSSPDLINNNNETNNLSTQQSWTQNSNWKPGPPPPPIGPNSLPPAPTSPAPPPPIRPSIQQQQQQQQPPPPIEPSIRESFMAQRQDRDTFGVHQNRVIQNNSKRNSFSANWDVQSAITQETHDESANWAKEAIDLIDKNNWDQTDSTIISEPNQRKWENKKLIKEENRPITFRTHQFSKLAQEREKKLSVASTQMTDKTDKNDIQAEWPEFMRPIKTPPLLMKSQENNKISPKTSTTRLLPLGSSACITYNRIPWQLRVRKEVFNPNETLGPLNGIHLIFCQIVADVYGITPCLRITQTEKRAGVNMLSGYGVTAENYNTTPHRANIKRNIIELARTWPLYFARLFPVSGAAQLSDVQLIAVTHWGVHLVKREATHLQVIKSFPLKEIGSCIAPRPTTICLDSPQGKISLHTPRAQQISEMVTKFSNENRKILQKSMQPPPQRTTMAPQTERLAEIITKPSTTKENLRLPSSPKSNRDWGERGGAINDRDDIRENVDEHFQQSSPGSPLPPSGKYSLMQFALNNFRQCAELELLKMDSIKSKEKRKEWTWKQQTDLIKWQGTPIEGPLLKLEDNELAPLAVECFECILRYCGDLPLTADMSEVKCVYTVLMHCHKYVQLRDEVYCQLMKQTTNNKSESPESCQRAWRLLSIVAAYFSCSDNLLQYLIEHLTSAATDHRRICHGTAAVCLTNLKKTQKCGGRKNVPSVEEVTAISAGRSARRQIYRLPGGAERVVNTRCSTVVADVISELCSLIGITIDIEQQEFSLYCIVQGDSFTMPLASDEYILDVTTELHKAGQPFYLIFCRSVWYHPLKYDASPLYTEVLFNQVAPDYLEGLLLKLGNINLSPNIVRDMAFIGALLHRAADLNHSPSLKEVKFLLPKPVLGLREPRPPQWLALVQTSWAQASTLNISKAKLRVLQILSNWPLFGSSFFAVKRLTNNNNASSDLDNNIWQEHILALNRNGVHFLDMVTHEILQHWPFAEVISTRKVRSEDGSLFLDMKCGNLLQQRVTRLQTEQAHEISRLVRQYINLEQTNIRN